MVYLFLILTKLWWPCCRRWFVLTPQYLCSFKSQGATPSEKPAPRSMNDGMPFFVLVGWKRCSNHLFGLGWKRQEKIFGICFFVESRFWNFFFWAVKSRFFQTWLWGEYRNPTEHIRHCEEYISLVHLLPSHLSLEGCAFAVFEKDAIYIIIVWLQNSSPTM